MAGLTKISSVDVHTRMDMLNARNVVIEEEKDAQKEYEKFIESPAKDAQDEHEELIADPAEKRRKQSQGEGTRAFGCIGSAADPPTDASKAIRIARLTAGTAQAHPSIPEPDDHRLSAGKLWGITSLHAMPSEPCVSKRRGGLMGKDANEGEKKEELAAREGERSECDVKANVVGDYRTFGNWNLEDQDRGERYGRQEG